MVFFSELQKRPVLDKDRISIGKLQDLVFIDGEEFAEVTHLIYKDDAGYRKKIPWRQVEELKEIRERRKSKIDIILEKKESELVPAFEKGDEFLLSDIMDKQVVDVHGIKVIRVNDIVLGKVEAAFSMVAVAVGMRSMLRRLGLLKILKFYPKKIADNIIKWQSVEPLDKTLHDIHVKIQKKQIADLHPEDIAEIMEDLDSKERALIFKTLDEKKRVRTLIDSEPHIQASFFKNLKLNSIANILENIPASNAADLLSAMTKPKAATILSYMNKDEAKEIREILHYPEEAAAAIMHTNFITVPKEFTVQKTIAMLRRIKPPSEKTYHLYVTNRNKRLLGILPIRSLITSKPGKKVAALMKKEVVKVHLNTTKEEIAKIIARYNLFAIPVIDKKEIIKGVVTADEVIDEIMPSSWKRRAIKPFPVKPNEGNES